MPWVGLNDGVIAGFGDREPAGGFADVLEYDTWEDAENNHSGFAELRKSSALSIALAKVDGFESVDSAHSIKAFEAIGYKYMKLPAEACVYCSAYAKDEGISLEDAIERVWEKHVINSAKEVARTVEKGRVRKSYNS